MSEILRIEALTAGYRGAVAIENIAFSATAGSVVALLGANGAGKSTLLKCIAGLMPTFSGRIRFEGRDVTGSSAIELVRAGIAYVPEGREIVTTLSVNENLTLGGLHMPKAALEQRRDLVLNLFPELVERLNSPSWQLSGGQQQMLAIGRALMSYPKVLLLDEPSLGLAPLLVQRVFNQLGELQRQFNLSVVLVEQNYRLTMRIADTAYFMRSGRIVGYHTAEELRTPEGYGKIISAYFGATASAA